MRIASRSTMFKRNVAERHWAGVCRILQLAIQLLRGLLFQPNLLLDKRRRGGAGEIAREVRRADEVA